MGGLGPEIYWLAGCNRNRPRPVVPRPWGENEERLRSRISGGIWVN